MIIGNGQFLHGDCLELMREIPDGSVDMILCDLPYGTTACSWDSVIPFEPLWEQYKRVMTNTGAIVLTASQPFTSALVMSNPTAFKYEWIWEKGKATGHLNAKRMPMKKHESVLVFAFANAPYYPQGLVDSVQNSARPAKGKVKGEVYGSQRGNYGSSSKGNYPKSVLQFSGEHKPVHPTQKPVALFEYLIRTYTNEGEHVLDNTAGSGTTAIAAENAGRRWTCMERDPTYYEAAIARVFDHVSV